jgi:DNA (cytosine-5)-methyltransferase 1
MRGFGDYEIDDKASALKSRDHKDATDLITVAVRTAQTSANGCGVSEDVAHTLDGALGQAVAFQSKASSTNSMNPSEITPTLDKGKGDGVVVASFKAGQGAKAGSIGYEEEVAPTLGAADSGSNRTPALMSGMTVRRLTPRECERLQGFPDNYTRIPRNHKKAADCPDGPRYKALGNSMAVPVMQWIGQRIQEVENGQ